MPDDLLRPERDDPPGPQPATINGPVVLNGSVGRNGNNFPTDVGKIGAALVAIGPDQGGIFAIPLSIDGLAGAIKSFQDFHRLPSRDGRVDRIGATLKKINSVLFPNIFPPAPTPTGTGQIKLIDSAKHGLSVACAKAVHSPIEGSLSKDMLFDWTAIFGTGGIVYFELDENVVPRWYGMLVPAGTTSFDKVHIFFHPTPGQAGHDDRTYNDLSQWKRIFHYLTDDMAAQFCAAGTGRIMIMPLMTQGSSGTCGVFPQRWESIVGKMLGMMANGNMTGSAPVQSISSVVVSSFSAGIAYSHAFISRAKLGSKLKGVIDFDGSFSTERSHSASVAAGFNPVIRMQQTLGIREADLPALAARNLFPLKPSRFNKLFLTPAKDDLAAMRSLHGFIPQVTMFVAAKRAG